MLLLGIDIGTSSVKVSVVNSVTQAVIASAQYPEHESPIIALKTGWAEQSPDMWWQQTGQAISLCHKKGGYDPKDIAAIGIAYQMHGLVLVDKDHHVLRNSIIWCDSRAVEIGDKAFEDIGHETCLSHMLNSPGNFTASKLAWVKQNEPEIYDQVDKIMLPGDYIAMKLTGEITTSASAMSEGIFFDFQFNGLSKDIIDYFGFNDALFPVVKPVFSSHGRVTADVAAALQLNTGTPVTYKAGDQPNNALSLNVLKPGEVAATAGTSGVIYGVSDQLAYDPQSRVNTFAHVNYANERKRLGVLLCINGTGSLYRWIKNTFAPNLSYSQVNDTGGHGSFGQRRAADNAFWQRCRANAEQQTGWRAYSSYRFEPAYPGAYLPRGTGRHRLRFPLWLGYYAGERYEPNGDPRRPLQYVPERSIYRNLCKRYRRTHRALQ
jgi:xylulokinase